MKTGRITANKMNRRKAIIIFAIVMLWIAYWHHGAKVPVSDELYAAIIHEPDTKKQEIDRTIATTPEVPLSRNQEPEIALDKKNCETSRPGFVPTITEHGIRQLSLNPQLSALTKNDVQFLLNLAHDIGKVVEESIDPIGEENKETLTTEDRTKSISDWEKAASEGNTEAERFLGKHLAYGAFKKYSTKCKSSDGSLPSPCHDLSTDDGFWEGQKRLLNACAKGDEISCFSSYFFVLIGEKITWRYADPAHKKEWEQMRIYRFAYAEAIKNIVSPAAFVLISHDENSAPSQNEKLTYPLALSVQEQSQIQEETLKLNMIINKDNITKYSEEKERISWFERRGIIEAFNAELESLCSEN